MDPALGFEHRGRRPTLRLNFVIKKTIRGCGSRRVLSALVIEIGAHEAIVGIDFPLGNNVLQELHHEFDVGAIVGVQFVGSLQSIEERIRPLQELLKRMSGLEIDAGVYRGILSDGVSTKTLGSGSVLPGSSRAFSLNAAQSTREEILNGAKGTLRDLDAGVARGTKR